MVRVTVRLASRRFVSAFHPCMWAPRVVAVWLAYGFRFVFGRLCVCGCEWLVATEI